MSEILSLETTNLRLEFDRESGSLRRLYSKVSDWDIIQRPHLAQSWRMMLPLENKRNNEAWGSEQKEPPKCQYDGARISFTWDRITSRSGITHPIRVQTTCKIEKDQAVFLMRIENRDSCIIENVFYPYIGDLHRPHGCERFSFQHGNYISMREYEMYPTFENQHGTHSVDYPTICPEDHMTPPMNPFGLISDNNGNGLYIGVASRRLEAATWHAEYLPGWCDSNAFRTFDGDQFEGKDVYIRFAVGHLPFVAPHTEFELLPFSMEAYQGSWYTGASLYTKVSRSFSTPAKTVPQWARSPHAWLQVHINSPEDELRMRFRDLPALGAECRRYGIKAIQLVGWNKGGQDRGNPSHDPDPRLGTFAEFKQAIQEIRQMGVKVILFTKFNWADQSTDEFKRTYEPMAIKDPYGNYYVFKGYQYMTLSQLTNVSTRRLIPMCFGSDAYLEVCKREFQKCLDLQPDGILYDECLHHSPTLCCFDTSHGHRYGACAYAWDERLVQSFRRMAGDREFLIAGEALYDFQHNDYDLSYARTWGRSHKPMTRFLRPESNIMTAVIGFDDRNMINQCLMYKYIISYEPYCFKGRPSDFPETIRYGMCMDRLRTDLREYFWDGTFTGQLHGNATLADGTALDTYSVFRAADGKYGMILCNYEENRSITVTPYLENGQKLTRYRLVESDSPVPFATSFSIPPRSAAAVIP